MSVSLPTLLLLLPLLFAGTFRVTRFVTRDKLWLIRVPRDAFECRWGVYDDAEGDERKISLNGKKTNIVMASLAYLWTCDWCTSVWVGSALTYMTWRWPETMLWVLIAISSSAATGFLAKIDK